MYPKDCKRNGVGRVRRAALKLLWGWTQGRSYAEMWAKCYRRRVDEGPVLSEDLGERLIFESDFGKIIL